MDLLDAHRQTLEAWRERTNLVGPGSIEPHYEDSERALAAVSPTGRWADLGTGAGFPGVVLAALYPEVAVDLVESRTLRCEFLEEVLSKADDDRPARLAVVKTRIERLPAALYDGVTARALAKPPVVCRLASKVLKDGGLLVLFLAEHTPIPEHRDFELVDARHYDTSTHRRLAAVLRRRPRAASR
jgi:16S rRNA (guanine527-N7)-methyltransferase